MPSNPKIAPRKPTARPGHVPAPSPKSPYPNQRINKAKRDIGVANEVRARRGHLKTAAYMLAAAVILLITLFGLLPRAHAQIVDDRYPMLGMQAFAYAPVSHGRHRQFEPDAGTVAMVDLAAFSAGVPSRIAHAVVRIESRYRVNARSGAGALGMMQIKCASARGIGFQGSCRDLMDAHINLTWGLKFLRLALDKGGSGCAGISLYNVGIYARPHCTAYGRMVMAKAR